MGTLKILVILDKDDNPSKYNSVKNELDAVYGNIIESIRIRSKCDLYEHSKKIKCFLNLEKQWGSQNAIKKLIVNDTEITDHTNFGVYEGILGNCFIKKLLKRANKNPQQKLKVF